MARIPFVFVADIKSISTRVLRNGKINMGDKDAIEATSSSNKTFKRSLLEIILDGV